MYTYIWTNHHAALLLYSESGAKKVPQNIALRTTILPGSCGADTIQMEVLRTTHYMTDIGLSLAVPLLMLWRQGCPKRVLMSGQLARVFQVLAKVVAMPSTSPLITLKSSLIMLLKFPHKPVGWHIFTQRYLTRCEVLQTNCALLHYNLQILYTHWN